jgi:hypothetical protein
MSQILKKLMLVCIILFIGRFAYGIKVGLDSGHSIKELYKSGGTFLVWKYNPDKDENELVPYFSLGWPAGGLNIVGSDGSSALNMSGIAAKIGAKRSYAIMVDSIQFPDWWRNGQDIGEGISFKTALQKIGRDISGVSSDSSFIAGFQDVRSIRGISEVVFQGDVKGILFELEEDFGQDKYKNILEKLRLDIGNSEGKEMKIDNFSKSMLGEEIKFGESCKFNRKYKNLKVFVSEDGKVRYRPVESIIEDSEQFPIPYQVGIVYLREEKEETGWVAKDEDLEKSIQRGAVYNKIKSSGVLNNIRGRESYLKFLFISIPLGNSVLLGKELTSEETVEIKWRNFEVDDKEKVIYSSEYIIKKKNGDYFRVRTDCGKYFYSWLKITKVSFDANGNITSEVDVSNIERGDDLVAGHPEVNETEFEARVGQLEYRLNWDIANKEEL